LLSSVSALVGRRTSANSNRSAGIGKITLAVSISVVRPRDYPVRGPRRPARRVAVADRHDQRNQKAGDNMTKVVNYLLARALVAAYRGNNYKLFIAMARLAARIIERKGTRWLH